MNTIAKIFAAGADPYHPDTAKLARQSRAEARAKEKRLRKFFTDPYDDGSERWYLADKLLDYLRAYKKEGSKRKNRFQENILHEFNIALFFKAMLQSDLLPRKVTYQKDRGGNIEQIPQALQSIELLFCTALFHDLDEDFADASPEDLEGVLTYLVSQETGLSDTQKNRYLDMTNVLGPLMEAITFGRSYRFNKRIKKAPTHDGDPQLYLDHMEELWPAILTKGGDRHWGIVERFGPVPDIFPFDRQLQYMQETEDLFYYRQTLENMAQRYPQLSEAFEVINARMNVAYRSVNIILDFHPNNPYPERKTANPATARLDIKWLLPKALKIQPCIEEDADDMKQLLVNLESVAARRPTLRPITRQLRDQLTDFMPDLENMLPPFDYHSETAADMASPHP